MEPTTKNVAPTSNFEVLGVGRFFLTIRSHGMACMISGEADLIALSRAVDAALVAKRIKPYEEIPEERRRGRPPGKKVAPA